VWGDASQVVQARLGLFESFGGPPCLPVLVAYEEMTDLCLLIGWPTFAALPHTAVIKRELDAILLPGRFPWARDQERPNPDRLDGVLEATGLFAATYLFAPGWVPAQAARVCAAINSAGGMDHAAAHNDALDLLDEAFVRQDVEAIDQATLQLAAPAYLLVLEHLTRPLIYLCPIDWLAAGPLTAAATIACGTKGHSVCASGLGASGCWKPLPHRRTGIGRSRCCSVPIRTSSVLGQLATVCVTATDGTMTKISGPGVRRP
jgi:hypothetical protein